MFEDSVFESAGRIHTRSSRWMVAVFFFNASILVAMILIPLIHPEALPLQHLICTCLMVPPTVQPEQPVPVQPITQTTHPLTQMDNGQFTVPTKIPRRILYVTGPEPAIIYDVASMGPGSAVTGNDLFHGPGVTVAPPVVRAPIRVSTAVEAGLLIHKIMPAYPPIARAARIEGTVRLEATISKAGKIENLRVISGQPMLQQAALDAVKNWLYRPYLLDGQPVEVETTVDVIFTMNH